MGEIKEISLESELRKSYLDYAMSVIVGRALPDVRDGLKPVHRRIIYAMYGLGNFHNKPYKKSARVVGEVLGKYHPHGDVAIYDALVRMAQDFSLRYPLIDGQGNFGSIDGDPPAAMRYTECRLSRIAEELLADIDKDTVDFVLNFDATLKEPVVLPARIPNLLINGSSGIAVGMATNIPPHNLSEVVDALILLIDNPHASIQDIMEVLPGPDFPTGGIIVGRKGIVEAYSTGHGSISIRGRAEVSEDGRHIIITEIPYMVNKANLITDIANLVKEKKLEGIQDIHDRSDKEGLRVVIDVKRGYDPEILLNKLYLMTDLEKSFGIINLALVNNVPRLLNIKQMLNHYIDFRMEVLIRKSRYELNKAKERLHIVEGLLRALEDIDLVIKLIRGSKDNTEAVGKLMDNLSLTEKQAKAILDMRLSRLTSLEREKLEVEHKELTDKIKDLEETLSDESKRYQLIKEELIDIKNKYGDERRTTIMDNPEELVLEKLEPNVPVVVLITEDGYIKRVSLDEYKQQKRGGKGVLSLSGEGKLKDVIIAHTHDYLLCITDKGRLHWLKVYTIPKGERYSKGRHIANLLALKDEHVLSWIPVDRFDERYLVFVSERGYIKKTGLRYYSHVRKGGIIALSLDEGDRLSDAGLCRSGDELLISTRNGMAIRFKESDVREMGRTARGVRGISLRGDDRVVSLTVLNKPEVLVLSENGYGKRTDKDNYRLQSRGGKGVINMKVNETTGHVVVVLSVDEDDEILVVSTRKTIRVPVKDIRRTGRSAIGVRVMRLDEGEVVKGASVIPIEEN